MFPLKFHSGYRLHAYNSTSLIERLFSSAWHSILAWIMESVFKQAQSSITTKIITYIISITLFIITLILTNQFFPSSLLPSQIFSHKQHCVSIHILITRCADQLNDKMKRQRKIKWWVKNVWEQEGWQKQKCKGWAGLNLCMCVHP